MKYQVPFLKSLVRLDLGLNPGLLDHWRILDQLDQWAGYKNLNKYWQQIYKYVSLKTLALFSVCIVFMVTGVYNINDYANNIRGCPRDVMVKAMDCGIVVSEFVLQLCYYVHFRANTFGKGMNALILPAMC